MRHHLYNPDFQFVKDPIEFDKYTDFSVLQYCLGATMYMPATKDFSDAIIRKKYPGLTTMAMCFEDAIKAEDVEKAQVNALNLLSILNRGIESGALERKDLPLIVFRVRNARQFEEFSAMLDRSHVRLIAGFNFPKFNSETGGEYFNHLERLNERFGEVLYGMPILEDRSMALLETQKDELLRTKEILDRHRNLVLNIRTGGTDFSASFGVRRDIYHTIYDIFNVSACLRDILNVFGRFNEYVVSGPVWEYFRVNSTMKFTKIPERFSELLFRRDTLINDAVDGLMRELLLDIANGFIGKTIIHPTHLPYVNGMQAVTRELYEDALQICDVNGGVIKSATGNKMNEIGPHRRWAERLLMRAKAYGVIESEKSYLKLFGCEEQ